VNGLALVAAGGGFGREFVFWICAVLAVVGALGMLISRKAVHSALFLVLTMVNLAVLYISMSAAFLGMAQIIVYTGAVMMLFLFVLMVVGVDASDSHVETIKGQRWLALILGLGFGTMLVVAIGTGLSGVGSGGLGTANAAYGSNIQGLAALIFGRYVLAFEVTSALLITAAMGAMVLAHRERAHPRPSQRELSEARFRSDKPGMLPNPGIYARHNAVGTPGLLPDGTPSELTVPEILRGRTEAVPAHLEPGSAPAHIGSADETGVEE
jgi:NADH-quinone oxidoreductase subunit J